MKRDIDKIAFFVENGANVNAKNGYGDTPLHEAVVEQRPDIALLLLDHGADMDILNNSGKSPLAMSKLMRDSSVAELLQTWRDRKIEEGSYSSFITQSEARKCRDKPLHSAVKRSDIEQVRFLLEHRNNPNARNILGNTPLHEAIFLKRTDIIRLLLKNGAKNDVANKNGVTPLSLSEMAEDSSLKELLLSQSAIAAFAPNYDELV